MAPRVAFFEVSPREAPVPVLHGLEWRPARRTWGHRLLDRKTNPYFENGQARVSIGFYAAENWTGASNNGTFMVFNNTLNGSGTQIERMRLDQNGNLGIGTSTPITKLHVHSLSAGLPATSGTAQPTGIARFGSVGDMAIDIGTDSASPWGSWIQSVKPSDLSQTFSLLLNPRGGNVGVGTTTPGFGLDVQADNGSARIAGSTASLTLNRATASVTAPDVYFQNRGAHFQPPTIVQNGDYLGHLGFGGYDGSDFSTRPAGLFAVVNGTVGAGSIPTDLAFSAGTSGLHPSNERMRITSAGNVGIGTTLPEQFSKSSPKTTTHPIQSSTYVTGPQGANFLGQKARGTMAAPTAVQTDDQLSVLIGRGYTTGSAFSGNIGAIGIYAGENFTPTNNGSYIGFSTTNLGGTTRTERMRIDPSGNVGIGTTSPDPARRLDVFGNIGNGGMDFNLGYSDQVSRYNSGTSRALVKWTQGTSSSLAVISMVIFQAGLK